MECFCVLFLKKFANNTNGQTHSHTHTHRERERERERDRQTDRQTDRETERQRDIQTANLDQAAVFTCFVIRPLAPVSECCSVKEGAVPWICARSPQAAHFSPVARLVWHPIIPSR